MEISKVFSSKNIWSMSVVFVVVLLALLVFPHGAKAATLGFEGIKFKIDTETDRLNRNGVNVRWSCSGDKHTNYGEINELTGTASESVGLQTADGIVSVASTSTEMTESKCDYNTSASRSLTATVSLDGWLTRVWSATLLASSSTGGDGMAGAFVTRASMDYTIVVDGVNDELSNVLQLDGSTASASYSAAAASLSYSSFSGNWKRYIAATANGTVIAEKDGYVKATSSTITGFSATTSRSVDFTSGTSNFPHAGLSLAVKVTVRGTTRFGESITGITGRTVTAGDGSATSCTAGSSGNYYCAVLLAESTGLTATSDAFIGFNQTLTCNYADRDTEDDGQTSCTINATEGAGAGDSGGGLAYTYETTPTPTPEVTPEVTPTPEPGLSPTSTPVPVGATVKLFRKANDPKVYVQKSDGTLGWVKTLADFNTAGYKWSDVKVISGTQFAAMKVGGNVRVVKGIAFLRVRAGPSTANKIVGKVLPGQELKFTEINNGWYHISSGWVSGAYAKEF